MSQTLEWTIHVETDNLMGGTFPVAGADVFLCECSAMTNSAGTVVIATAIPESGATVYAHRIGYKPERIYVTSNNLNLSPEVTLLMESTYEIATHRRVSEVFPEFDSYLPGNLSNNLNWDNLIGYTTHLNTYSIVDPWDRQNPGNGDTANLFMSDFCTDSWYSSPHSAATYLNPIQYWECNGRDDNYDHVIVDTGEMNQSYHIFSGSTLTPLGGFRAPSDDFIIGLPCMFWAPYGDLHTDIGGGGNSYKFRFNRYDASYIDTDLYVANQIWGQFTRTFSGITETRLCNLTPGEYVQVNIINNPAYFILDSAYSPSKTYGITVKVDEQNLYLRESYTDYWSCYERNFSQDGYNHYNGPFGPTYK